MKFGEIAANVAISIHALREESDILRGGSGSRCAKFLSTLSVRRATQLICSVQQAVRFLSTLSVRRATCRCLPRPRPARYFYPRSP